MSAKRPLLHVSLALAVLALGHAPLLGQFFFDQGTNTDWFEGSNWNLGSPPSAGTDTYISEGKSAVVASSGAATGTLLIGYTGSGTLTVQDGGTGTSERIQFNDDGRMAVTGTGSAWTVSDAITINATSGANHLTVSNGGKVTANSFLVGSYYLGTAYQGNILVTGAGSQLIDTAPGPYFGLMLGQGDYYERGLGSGTMTIADGASATNGTAALGYWGNGSATVTGSGSTWNIGALYLGYDVGSSGALTVEQGASATADQLYLGFVNANGGYNRGTGTVIVRDSGSVLTAGGTFVQISEGSSVTVANGGTFKVGSSGTGVLYVQPSGSMNIGSGGAAGTLQSASVNNLGALVFDFTGNLTFSTQITQLYGGSNDTGTVTKRGAGTLTLSANNSYTGGTVIEGGTVRATGSANSLGLGPLTLSGGHVTLANNTALNFARPTTVSANATITSDRGSISGAGVTHTLGTLSIGAQTLTLSPGTLVTSGTAGLTFGAATLTGNATFATTAGTQLTLASVTESGGSHSLTKTDAGTLLLTGAASHTGGTIISGGTLQVGNGGTGGSLAGDVVNNGTLAFNRSNAVAISGNITGTGALTKAGAGTLTLSGTNDYTGATTVTGGTLALANADSLGSGTLTLNGATLQWGSGNTADVSARLAALGSSGATFDTNSNNVAFASSLSGSGAFTKSGSGTLTLSSANTNSGLITVSAGTLAISGDGTFGSSTTAVTVSGGILDLGGLSRTNGAITLSGGTLQNGTLTGSSYAVQNGTISAVLAGTGALTKTTSGTVLLSGANTFSGGSTLSAGTVQVGHENAFGSGTLTLSGGALHGDGTARTLANAVNIASASTIGGSSDLTFTGTLTNTVAGNPTLTVSNSGTTTFGNIALANASTNRTVTINNSGTVEITGIISNGGTSSASSFTKSGSGTLTLSAANTYSGTTTVSAGTLLLSGNGRLGGTSSAVTVSGTGVLDLGGLSRTNGTVTLSGGTLQNGTMTGSSYAIQSGTVTATLAGTGNLTKSNSGTATLGAANTYSGTTTVSAGTLVVTTNNALGTVANGTAVNNAATLELRGGVNYSTTEALALSTGTGGGFSSTNGNNTWAGNVAVNGQSRILIASGSELSLTGVVSGSAAFSVNSGGILRLSNASNSFFGSVNINGDSTVIASANGALGGTAGQINVNAGTLAFTGGIDYSSAKPVTLVGNGATTRNGALDNISGNNSFSGNIILSDPTTRIGAAAGTRLTLDGSIWSAVAGWGPTFAGPGTIVLTGTNSYSGATTVTGGVVQFSSLANLGSASTVVLNGGALRYASGSTVDLSSRTLTIGSNGGTIDTQGNAITFANAIGNNGAGRLTKLGSGSLTLSAANTYTGGTTLADGTLVAGHNNAFGSGSVTVTGGVLDTGTVSLANAISLTGGTLMGRGTLGGLTTIGSGAHLAPGHSPGTLTFTNGLTLAGGSILDLELGTVSDLIRVSGGTLTGPASTGGITLNLSAATGFGAATYTLFDFAGASLNNFDLADFTFGITPDGFTYSLAFNGDTLQLTTASAIPEPSTYAALAGLAALGLALYRRRRRSAAAA